MKTIKQTRQFKRDLKREAKGKHGGTLENALMPVLIALAADEPLPQQFCDHALSGNKKGFRDCHIKSDLVLIYKKQDEDTLLLIRLGSHSELNI